mmetsp:Transcript_30810/g.77169  ORF Transcript_30810/g.77169 Transcript_30810/m.77169 type:complete len:274 (+) Transcript_30810:3749-4570(+)
MYSMPSPRTPSALYSIKAAIAAELNWSLLPAATSCRSSSKSCLVMRPSWSVSYMRNHNSTISSLSPRKITERRVANCEKLMYPSFASSTPVKMCSSSSWSDRPNACPIALMNLRREIMRLLPATTWKWLIRLSSSVTPKWVFSCSSLSTCRVLMMSDRERCRSEPTLPASFSSGGLVPSRNRLFSQISSLASGVARMGDFRTGASLMIVSTSGPLPPAPGTSTAGVLMLRFPCYRMSVETCVGVRAPRRRCRKRRISRRRRSESARKISPPRL